MVSPGVGARHYVALRCCVNSRRHTSLLGRQACSTYRKYASHPWLHRYLVWLATCHSTTLTHYPASERFVTMMPAATSRKPPMNRGVIGSPRSAAPSTVAARGLSARQTATRVGVICFRAQTQSP